MRCVLALWLVLTTAVALLKAQDVSNRQPDFRFIARTPPLAPEEQRKKFHLPPGFQIELVAAEPDIRKPINLDFDAKGRLLVSTSIEYPNPAAAGARARDVIKILADADQDGAFERVETLAHGLNVPIGVTAIAGGALVYSIPNVYRFFDYGGDGRADKQEVAYGGFGFEDPHGMANAFNWWIDGWVYACHGEANTSMVADASGRSITMRGGNTFRMRPDGSRIELFTHGQANPFGLCFDPLGNAYSADSHSKPAYLLLRGGWYPSLGSPHDGLGFVPPIMRHYHGSTGIAGVAYYAADQFPAEYRDTLFLGNPVTGRINHDRLETHGSSYRAIEQPDFLTCDDLWFRPVDLQLGPDGALYIADFYNLFIGRYMGPDLERRRDRERGRIWRVVYAGHGKDGRTTRPIPDLANAKPDELVGFMRDPNLVVRTHATHQLAERVRDAELIKRVIRGDCHPWQRVHGLWVLHRLGALHAGLLRRLADDPHYAVRVHLLKAIAEQSDWGGDVTLRRELAVRRLSDPNAFVRRAAADALAKYPSPANVTHLLRLWAETPADDTLLIHTARMALRDNLQAMGDIPGFVQTIGAGPDDLRRLADVSLGIRTAGAAEFVFRCLQSQPVESVDVENLLHHAARFLDADLLPELYDFVQTFRGKDEELQKIVLRALHQAAGERQVELPAAVSQWALDLGRELLASKEDRLIASGIELVWDLRLARLGGDLAELARQPAREPWLRSFAMDALGAADATRALQVLEAVLENASEPIEVRGKAADVLGKINNDRSRSALNESLTAAPARLAAAIARQLSLSQEGAALLFEAVEQGGASAHLLQDPVVDQQLRATKLAGVEERLSQLLDGLPSAEERLRRMVAQRLEEYAKVNRSPKEGGQVFEKNCSVCHQVAGKGGDVGPQLDGIGVRGLERLLEDTLDPSRTVADRYRSSVILLDDGRILTGLVLSEEDGSLVLADAEGKQQRISVGDIEDRRLSKLSPMPADVAEKLSAAEYYHLVSYLLSLKD